ncbi:MAG: hypothetical protein KAX19_09165 [Candidatus Brocadiae bacterium]|nr:hypothetical protein [Candidatus Brocadiia bacterium]
MGCGCILTTIALLMPRVLMVVILLMTDWFGRAYETVIWPVLGFLFMPYTTLAYMAAHIRGGGLSGGWLALLIVAVILDIGHWGGGGHAAIRRR